MEDLEIKILSLMIFAESFSKLRDESSEFTKANILSDILKNLIHRGYVFTLLPDDKGQLQRSLGFDSDALQDYHYQLTSKGVRALESSFIPK